MRNKTLDPVLLCGLPFGGYPKGYVAMLSRHPSLENAQRWGRVSGLCSWPGGDRAGRVWIEQAGRPATLKKERL